MTFRKFKKYFIIFLALVTAGLIILFRGPEFFKEENPEPPKRRVKTHLEKKTEEFKASLKRIPSPKIEQLYYAFKQGDVLSYDVEFEFDINLNVNKTFVENLKKQNIPVASEQNIHNYFAISGNLVIKVYLTYLDKFILGYSFENMKVTVNLQDQRAPKDYTDNLEQQLNCEVKIQMNRQGEIDEIYFPPKTETQTRNFLKGFIASTVFVFPRAIVDKWETDEEDFTGRFKATYFLQEYVKSDEKTFAKILKQKKYTDITLEASEDVPKDILKSVKSNINVHTEAQSLGLFETEERFFNSIEVDEKTSIGGEYLMYEVSFTTHHTILFKDKQFNSDIARLDLNKVRNILKKMERTTTLKGEGSQISLVDIQWQQKEKEVGNKSVEEIIEQLKKVVQQENPHAERGKLCDWLAFLFKKNDVNVDIAMEIIDKLTLDKLSFDTVLNAMGNAGTEYCQRMLIKIASDDKFNEEEKCTAIGNLAVSKHPIEEAERFLKNLMEISRMFRRIRSLKNLEFRFALY